MRCVDKAILVARPKAVAISSKRALGLGIALTAAPPCDDVLMPLKRLQGNVLKGAILT